MHNTLTGKDEIFLHPALAWITIAIAAGVGLYITLSAIPGG